MDYTVSVNPSHSYLSHIAKFMGPTWDPPGSCRPQVGKCWPHERCYQGIYYFCNNKPVTTRQLTGPKPSWETAPYGIYVVQCIHWHYNATTFHDYACGSRCVMLLSLYHCVLFRSDYRKSDVHAKGQGQSSKIKVTEVQTNFAPVWAFLDRNSSLNSQMTRKWYTNLVYQICLHICGRPQCIGTKGIW